MTSRNSQTSPLGYVTGPTAPTDTTRSASATTAVSSKISRISPRAGCSPGSSMPLTSAHWPLSARWASRIRPASSITTPRTPGTQMGSLPIFLRSFRTYSGAGIAPAYPITKRTPRRSGGKQHGGCGPGEHERPERDGRFQSPPPGCKKGYGPQAAQQEGQEGPREQVSPAEIAEVHAQHSCEFDVAEPHARRVHKAEDEVEQP